jgi:2-furoyl-CoA dehydrogenase large subunit
MDKVAALTGLDPAEARRRNFIGAGEFPYRTPTGGLYDSGDYRRAFDLALKNADYDALRAEQDAARSRGEYFGIGLAAVADPSATNIGYVGLATPADQRAAWRGVPSPLNCAPGPALRCRRRDHVIEAVQLGRSSPSTNIQLN